MQYIFVPKDVNVMVSKPLSTSFNVRKPQGGSSTATQDGIITNGEWKAEIFHDKLENNNNNKQTRRMLFI